MLTVVLAVAVVGTALLAAAVLTGNPVIAVAVIAIAVVGLVLLGRDWLAERRQRGTEPHGQANEVAGGDATEAGHGSDETRLKPDEFEPDVPYDEPDTGAEDAEDSRETEHHGAGSDSD